MSPSRNDGLLAFQAKAEALLPEQTKVIARNRAVTGTYASLYLKRRDLFKWAGMAAFASHRVGISLIPFGIDQWVEDKPRFIVPEEHKGRAASINDDLNLLRVTNNRVYGSIAWAHIAFDELDDDGEAVLDLCAGDPQWKLLRSGWERIGYASRRLKQGEPYSSVAGLIWRGNEDLLRFEQEVTVQAGFDSMDRAFTTFMTWAMSMEFDGDNYDVELDTFSYFPLYMWTSAFAVLLRTRSLPRVDRFDHRWTWVEGRLLPLWKHVDGRDRELPRKLERLCALAANDNAQLARRTLVPRTGKRRVG